VKKQYGLFSKVLIEVHGNNSYPGIANYMGRVLSKCESDLMIICCDCDTC